MKENVVYVLNNKCDQDCGSRLMQNNMYGWLKPLIVATALISVSIAVSGSVIIKLCPLQMMFK